MNRPALSVIAVAALLLSGGLVAAPAAALPAAHDAAELVRVATKADPDTRAAGDLTAVPGGVRAGGVAMVVGDARDLVRVGERAVMHGHGADYVSQAVRDGFQVLAVIADETGATQTYRLPGRFLEVTPGGSVIVRKGGRTGEPVAVIDPAWARDANGAPVPSRFEVDGDLLTQSSDVGPGTAFPVVADPRVRVAWYGASVDFSRAETKAISQAGNSCSVILGFAGVIAGQAGLSAAVIVAALTAGCGAAAVLADVAMDSGKCLSVKIFAAVPGATAPWISTCYK